MSIRLVVFDLGRVMIRIVDGWAQACRKAGVPYPAACDTPAVRQELNRVGFQHEIGAIDDDTWARQTAKLTGLTPAQAMAVSYAWLEGPFPGWPALLDRLGQTPVRTACLSNTNAIHWKLMSSPGPNQLPLDRLSYRFASHLVRVAKPEPAIFAHVEAATGVTPAEILFFDDAPANIAGARARGWGVEEIDISADPVAQVERALKAHGVL